MSAFREPENNVQVAFSPWAPKTKIQTLLKKLEENEAWKMFSTTIKEQETETNEPGTETNNSLDNEDIKTIQIDNDITNANVEDELDDVERGEMITESDDANDTLMQTLSEGDIQRLRNIANKNRDLTESDEEALLKASDTSNTGSELNFPGLSETDARNDESEEAEANNSDSTNDDEEDLPKFSRAGRRGSCLIRADSKSDLYTQNGTTVNVDLVQPEHKPVTPLSGVVDIVRLTRLVGHGGFGAVYEGWWGDVNVAVKQMIPCTKNDKAKIESFKAELNVVNLSHPNVVNILASTPLDELGSPYLIMEYVGQKNLQQIISNTDEEVLDTERRLRFSQDIACALQYIHVNGIVHLDVKPSNVLVTSEDRCKLGDFGCCQVLDGGTGRVSPIQRAYVTGTFAYRAPELLRGEAPCAKADVYSFGITLWEMLSRTQAYAGQNPHVVIFGVVAYKLRPSFEDLGTDPGEEGDVVEQCYRDLLRECWEGNALERPSAQDLADVLYLWNAYF